MFKKLSALMITTLFPALLAQPAGATTFTTATNGKCLDIQGGMVGAAGTLLQTYSCNGTAAQDFKPMWGKIRTRLVDGPILTGMNFYDGYKVRLYNDWQSPDQRWRYVGATVWARGRDLLLRVPAPGIGMPIPTGASYPYSGVAYVSQTASRQLRLNDGRCLEVRGSANGTRVVTNYCTTSLSQQWDITPTGIVSLSTQKCLTLPPYTVTSSTYAEIRDCASAGRLSLWASIQQDNGSNRCITTSGTNPADWAPVTLQPCAWTREQSWMFHVGY